MSSMWYQIAVDNPPNLSNILLVIILLVVGWVVLRFIFKIAKRVFMLGCVAILVVGAFLFFFNLLN
jgi:ABC-type iron transport system FetAB permease component